MQHERVGVGAKLGNDERNPMSHQPADEMHVSGQPVELGDDDRTLHLAGSLQRRVELWSAVERISAFAGLDLDIFGNEIVPLRGSELLDGHLLRLDPPARSYLVGLWRHGSTRLRRPLMTKPFQSIHISYQCLVFVQAPRAPEPARKRGFLLLPLRREMQAFERAATPNSLRNPAPLQQIEGMPIL
jgi:hypothetical protein